MCKENCQFNNFKYQTQGHLVQYHFVLPLPTFNKVERFEMTLSHLLQQFYKPTEIFRRCQMSALLCMKIPKEQLKVKHSLF